MKKKWNEWSTRRKIVIITALVGFILLITFIFQNTQDAQVNFLAGTANLSVAFLMFLCVSMGALIVGIVIVPKFMKLERASEKQYKELRATKASLKHCQLQLADIMEQHPNTTADVPEQEKGAEDAGKEKKNFLRSLFS